MQKMPGRSISPPGGAMPSFVACLRALLLSLLLFGGASARAAIETDHLERSVVRVVIIIQNLAGEVFTVGHGSGFAVSPTQVVTNAHVVNAAKEYEGQDYKTGILVVPSRGKDFAVGTVQDISTDADLALLKVEKTTLPRVTLFAGTVGADTDVVALGYPGNVDRALGRDADARIMPSPPERTQARLSSVREGAPWNSALETYLHDARIGPGYSGGPLSDACGRVLGVNTAVTENGDGDAQYAFTIAGPGLRAFLRKNEVEFAVTSEPCLDAAAAAEARYSDQLKQRADAARQADEASARERQHQQDLLVKLAEQHDTQRRNDIISIGLALVMLAALSFAIWRWRKGERAWGVAGTALAIGTLVGIVLIERSTPSTIDPLAAQATLPPSAPSDAIPRDADVHCTLDRPSSHITLTDANDTDFHIAGGQCVNGKTLYAPSLGGIARVEVAKEDESASLTELDPKTGRFTSSLYLLDQPSYAQAAKLAEKYGDPVCSGAPSSADTQQMADRLAATRALLPAQATQVIAWNCSAKGK
jgi:serine protease Do